MINKSRINTCLIAAAGKGTRMLHLVKNKPKHLINVEGEPFLYYLLKNIEKAGIEEVIIIIGHKKEAFEDFLNQYSFNLEIKLIDQFEKTDKNKYGSAMPVLAAKDLLENKSFIAVYGDNLYSPKDITRFKNNDPFNYIGALNHKNPEKYGVIQKNKNNFLTDITEKPENPPSNFINTGIYKFTPDIFSEVKYLKPSPRDEYELTDAVKSLADNKKVKVITLQDYWFDFGNPSDIPEVSQFIKNNHD